MKVEFGGSHCLTANKDLSGDVFALLITCVDRYQRPHTFVNPLPFLFRTRGDLGERKKVCVCVCSRNCRMYHVRLAVVYSIFCQNLVDTRDARRLLLCCRYVCINEMTLTAQPPSCNRHGYLARTCAHAHTHAHTKLRTHAPTHTHTHAHTHTHTHERTHTHARTHARTHTHTYLHLSLIHI